MVKAKCLDFGDNSHMCSECNDFAKIEVTVCDKVFYLCKKHALALGNSILRDGYYRVMDYKPTCPYGYTDCISDPEYIKFHHPAWYAKLLEYKDGDMTSCCDCKNGDSYDDEDK